MSKLSKDEVFARVFAQAEQEKDSIKLGSNTERGFTGHLVTHRNPSGKTVETELWVKKELDEFLVKCAQGAYEPTIDRNATFLKCEPVRFSNLLVILQDEVARQLSLEYLPVGKLLATLASHDRR